MTFLKKQLLRLLAVAAVFFCLTCNPPASRQEAPSGWPSVGNENRPWTRWWWHGNAVTKEGITAEMEAYHAAGIGGLEITPIYGVYGEEDQFVEYLSPRWMDLLDHVLKEGQRLGMGIDMATGTGWPFGGPWVSSEDACKNVQYKMYEVKGGSALQEKVEFIQQPYLRLIGSQLHHDAENDEQAERRSSRSGTEPHLVKANEVDIADLVDPVHRNANLQALAIDQVQFEKPLKLRCLMAYGDENQTLDLTDKVDASGNLNWTAPSGAWKLYAVFEGLHGKMVERAAPGGEGNVIDHFSAPAVKNYLQHFDEAIKDRDISSLRAFFNDSYEVDDARGSADFTPELFSEFNDRRGYDLRSELPALFGHGDKEKSARVLCDYRETLSELLLDNFTRQWKSWANDHGALVRNQAHGAPSNILDLYAVVDIPEIEGTEPLRFKMATSSGNVSGKKLISAEAATWLNEHFTSSLADIKAALDKFLLHGVNHVVYHGTCYSPPGEPWPGRLFYAAVHLNPRNPMWKDADKLSSYITGCQSFLQRARPDNDVLLYYPVYDRFSTRGKEMIDHFDGIGTFAGTSFERCAALMLEKGYAFDFISDKQIGETTVENGLLKTSGNSHYKTLVIPRVDYMPLQTLEKISSLAESGASVIFIDNGPAAVSGYSDLESNRARFEQTLSALTKEVRNGRDLLVLLDEAGIRREPMFDAGIQGIRKKDQDGDWIYFINNSNPTPFEGWLPIAIPAEGIMLFDPMTGSSGEARIRKPSAGTEVFVRLEPAQSLILESYTTALEVPRFPYMEVDGQPVALTGKWKVTFESGGPELPPSFETEDLRYWTESPHESYKNFSGVATYQLSFNKPPAEARRWLLKITSVKETAEVFLNGKSVGKMIGPVYQVAFDGALLKRGNVIQIRVANLMANRIAYMDRNNIFWKRFYNVNFPARLRENTKDNLFTAAHWPPRPSGLKGKVELFPLR